MTAEPWVPEAPDAPPREATYDECPHCYAELTHDVECPACYRLVVEEGDKVRFARDTFWVGTMTGLWKHPAAPDDSPECVVVKWDSGVTERVPPNDLRRYEP